MAVAHGRERMHRVITDPLTLTLSPEYGGEGRRAAPERYFFGAGGGHAVIFRMMWSCWPVDWGEGRSERRRTMTVVPLPGEDSMEIWPPCAAAMPLQMAS